jgi:hypothetical protein
MVPGPSLSSGSRDEKLEFDPLPPAPCQKMILEGL